MMKANETIKQYLTLDIGGSSIKYALITDGLEILEKGKIPVPLDRIETLIEAIGGLYDQFKDRIVGMPISMCGVIDPNSGHCYSGGSLAYIQDVNLIEIIQTRCPTKITIGNDAKCAALAEVRYGVMQGISDGIVVVLGTGIGGCLIKDNKIHMGHNYSAGEFSMIRKSVNIGKNTLWAQQNGSQGLLEHVQEQLDTAETFTGEEIFALAKRNEKVMRAIELFCEDFALNLFNLQAVFDCELVAIGGGISNEPLLIEKIKEAAQKVFLGYPFPIVVPEIKACEYRNDANLIGALAQMLQS